LGSCRVVRTLREIAEVWSDHNNNAMKRSIRRRWPTLAEALDAGAEAAADYNAADCAIIMLTDKGGWISGSCAGDPA
jgi:hypothetical protein